MMSDETNSEERSAAGKGEEKEPDPSKIPVNDQPKSVGSLADAQAQRHMERALGRSTHTNLSKFTGNRLDAIKPPGGTEDGATETSKAELPKESFEKQRGESSAKSLEEPGSMAGVGVLILVVILIGGLYLYMQPKAKTSNEPVLSDAAGPAQGQDSTQTKILLTKAQAYMKAGDYRDAVDAFKSADQADPENRPTYLERIGDCYKRLKDYKGLESSSRALLQLQPESIKGLLQHSLASYSLGNKLTARNDLFNAVKIAPSNPEVILARGLYYLSEKEYPAAEADITQAIKLDPQMPGAKEKLAVVKQAQKSTVATHLKPRAVASAKIDEPQQATFSPSELQQLKSSDLNTLRQAGLDAMTHKKFAFAVAALERCVVINPNDAQSRKLLAYAMINTGNANAAFDQFNAWDSLTKLGLDEQLSFGRALRKAGDDATTTAFFNFLADDNSTNAQNLLRIAQSADKAGCANAVDKAVNYGLKISTGTQKYQFTVLMRKLQNGQIGIEDTAPAAFSSSGSKQ